MAFHRFKTATYNTFGGLNPDGSQREVRLINVVSEGTGSGGSAPVDGATIGGNNPGTFLVSFEEDATSSSVNRGLKVLSENTDELDNVINGSLGIIGYKDIPFTSGVGILNSAGGSPDDDIYVIKSGELSTFASSLAFITDINNRPIYSSNTRVVAALITNELGQSIVSTSLDGFSSGEVRIYTNPAINSTCRVWYIKRSTYSRKQKAQRTVNVDAISINKSIADIQSIPYRSFEDIYNNTPFSESFKATGTSTNGQFATINITGEPLKLYPTNTSVPTSGVPKNRILLHMEGRNYAEGSVSVFETPPIFTSYRTYTRNFTENVGSGTHSKAEVHSFSHSVVSLDTKPVSTDAFTYIDPSETVTLNTTGQLVLSTNSYFSVTGSATSFPNMVDVEGPVTDSTFFTLLKEGIDLFELTDTTGTKHLLRLKRITSTTTAEVTHPFTDDNLSIASNITGTLKWLQPHEVKAIFADANKPVSVHTPQVAPYSSILEDFSAIKSGSTARYVDHAKAALGISNIVDSPAIDFKYVNGFGEDAEGAAKVHQGGKIYAEGIAIFQRFVGLNSDAVHVYKVDFRQTIGDNVGYYYWDPLNLSSRNLSIAQSSAYNGQGKNHLLLDLSQGDSAEFNDISSKMRIFVPVTFFEPQFHVLGDVYKISLFTEVGYMVDADAGIFKVSLEDEQDNKQISTLIDIEDDDQTKPEAFITISYRFNGSTFEVHEIEKVWVES